MASRKNRNANRLTSAVAVANPAVDPAKAAIQANPLWHGDWTVVVLVLMIFLAPALGVPHEELLQDTLKSAVISVCTLSAALLLFLRLRRHHADLHWHGLIWLPMVLCVYALGSMVWSHTYLAAVEAIRWFVFSLLLWLGLNSFTPERVSTLAWGIHSGAFVASLWTVLQFWLDFSYFPQGASPASSFINRNFLAEFVVCTLPFSVLLIARSRQSAPIALLAFSTGLNVVAILMTGTRSALLALLAMVLVLPLILLIYRKQMEFAGWSLACRALLVSVLLGTVLGLGSIPCGDARILQEHAQGTLTALQRASARSRSIIQPEENTQRSFSEILQLLAEYGLLGWVFLLGLLGYLGKATWHTLRDRSPVALADAPLRALTLTSLMMLLIVSNAGFPWRLASTGALFALALALLAASDARLNHGGLIGVTRLPLQPIHLKMGAVTMALSLALTAFITQQAAACEAKIMRAVKLALSIRLSGNGQDSRWDVSKQEMLELIRQGIDINPHYRKLTPTVAEELARWGDWKNALWIWESLHQSRPNLVALVTNMARGHAELGHTDKAFDYLARAKKLQPGAAAVNSLEVILLSRTGQERQAYTQAKALIASDRYDYDLVNAAYVLAFWAKDWPMALQALQLRNKGWPAQASDGWLKIGNLYASVPEIKDDAKALAAYRQALSLGSISIQPSLRSQIPAVYLPRLIQK